MVACMRIWAVCSLMLNEIQRIESLLDTCPNFFRLTTLCIVKVDGIKLPVYGVEVGTQSGEAPVFSVVGGVHGLERVGCHVALSWLESLAFRLRWDKSLQHTLSKVRVLSVPLVNPGGLYGRTRANPNGVDLMRNAPVEGEDGVSFLVGGHRISKLLPWHRGDASAMEPESQALIDFLQKHSASAPALMTVDCHSGFGLKDRLWYPYAKKKGGFPGQGYVDNIVALFEAAHPNHPYVIEPQSVQYTTHGDLWDYLYDVRRNETNPDSHFVPWTLEMGSWSWVRKNPRQLFSAFGPFNPTIPHRYKRTMRRHLFLFDIFLSLTLSYESWASERV